MVELNAIVDGVAASGLPYTKDISLPWVTKQESVYKCWKKQYGYGVRTSKGARGDCGQEFKRNHCVGVGKLISIDVESTFTHGYSPITPHCLKAEVGV